MFKKYTLLTLLAMLLPLLGGCTDDIFDSRNPFGEAEEAPGLRINVPDVIGTRAGATVSNPDTPTPDETKIYSLHLYAYKLKKESGAWVEDGDPKVYSLFDPSANNNNPDNVTVKEVGKYDKYKTYELENFPKGRYKFYIIANISAPLAENVSEISDLKNQTMNYIKEMMIYPQGGEACQALPMTGDYRDMYTVSGSTETALPDEGYEFNGGATIYSDLVYCLAKVTVKMEETDGEYLDLVSAELSNFAGSFPYFTTSSTNPSVSPSGTKLTVEGDGNLKPTDATTKTYTFYVPENSYAGSPKLTVTSSEAEHSFSLGELDESRGVYDLKRGHHYAYTLSKRGDITLDVYSWQLDKFSVKINAPYELILYNGDDFQNGHVTMPISSTESRRIKYYTDAETITIVSPEFTYKDPTTKKDVTVDFYDWKPDGDELVVWVNNAVPLSLYNSSTEQEKYKYFHVVANNLMKRVEVDIIGVTPTFSVNPTSNIVDLRELIGLGYQKYSYPVKYSSNFGKVKVEIGDWTDSNGDPIVQSLFDQVGSLATTTATTESYTWTFEDFDKGKEFYKDRRYLTAKFTIEPEAGNTDDQTYYDQLVSNGDPTEYEVTFSVIPYNSNYIIHFKPNPAWSEPHIYAYQCLELPYNLDPTDKNYAYRGRTVGANKDQAALQYCFSSGFAFRGWLGYGGDIDPNEVAGSTNNGFFIFGEGAKRFYPYSDGFGSSGLTTATYRWYDFNAAHYYNLENSTVTQTKCPYDQCDWEVWPTKKEDQRICKLWPGIKMEDEGNGWWKYELSGVAEPGKTLLMFANNHSRGENDYTRDRFPADNDPGVPLFDFETKEGWFLLVDQSKDQSVNYFRSSNPDGKPLNYRLYWPKNYSGQIYVHLDGGSMLIGYVENHANAKDGEYGAYYYKDFSYAGDTNKEVCWDMNSTTHKKSGITLGNFKKESKAGNRYCAYLDGSYKGHAGMPVVQAVTYKYAIKGEVFTDNLDWNQTASIKLLDNTSGDIWEKELTVKNDGCFGIEQQTESGSQNAWFAKDTETTIVSGTSYEAEKGKSKNFKIAKGTYLFKVDASNAANGKVTLTVTKTGSDPVDDAIYKLYWPEKYDNYYMKDLYNCSGGAVSTGTAIKVRGENYYSADLGQDFSSGTYIIRDGGDWNRQTINMNVSSSQFDDNKEAYIVYIYTGKAKEIGYEVHPGKPGDDHYTLYWPKSKDGKDLTQLFYCDGSGSTKNANEMTINGTAYCYFDFGSDAAPSGSYLIRTKDSFDKQTVDFSLGATDFINKNCVISFTGYDNNKITVKKTAGAPSGVRRKTMKRMPKVLKRR